MRNTHRAVINFMYFGYNYTEGFIDKVWAAEPRIAAHLNTKFNYYYSLEEKSAFAMFFQSLSEDNKVLLCDWIEHNYSYDGNLKTEYKGAEEEVYIDYLDKDNRFQETRKHFISFDAAKAWAWKHLEKFDPDMVKYKN